MSQSLSCSKSLPPHYPCVFFSLRYGKIVSTKAILDKSTNKCKGERTAVFGDGEQLRVRPPLASALYRAVLRGPRAGEESLRFSGLKDE